MSILIVLFGQENDADGKLRAPAAARAAKAAEIWKETSSGSEVVILPTGAFGQHFNLSGEPHHHYLTRELIRLGVPTVNILPGVASSNTEQDATEAWYRFKSGGFHKLIAITSDYHAMRVALILGRLSASDDADIEVIPAETPGGYAGKDIKLEPKKIERLKRDWVDVIPRSANVANERFAAVYEETGREHRHYEMLSLAVVAILVVLDAFAFWIVQGRSGWGWFLTLLLLAIINLLLWSLYNRMDAAAGTARRVLRRMEIEHRIPAFSSNWRPQIAEWYEIPPWHWPMRDLVIALGAVLLVNLLIVSLTGGNETRTEPAANRSTSVASNTAAASPTPAITPPANAIDRFANAVMSSANNSNTNLNTRRRR